MPQGGSFWRLAATTLEEAGITPTMPAVNRLANADTGLNASWPNVNNIPADAVVNVFTPHAAQELTALATNTHLPFEPESTQKIRNELRATNTHLASTTIDEVRQADDQMANDIVAAGPDALAGFEPASQSDIMSYMTFTTTQALNDFADTWNTGTNNPEGFDDIGRIPGQDGDIAYVFSKNKFGLSINVSEETDNELTNAFDINGYPQRFRAIESIAPHIKSIHITPDTDNPITYSLTPKNSPDGSTQWKIQELHTHNESSVPSTQWDKGTFGYIVTRTEQFLNTSIFIPPSEETIFQGCPPENEPQTPKNATPFKEIQEHPEEFLNKGPLLVPIKETDWMDWHDSLLTEGDNLHPMLVFAEGYTPKDPGVRDEVLQVEEARDGCERELFLQAKVVQVKDGYAFEVHSIIPPPDGIAEQTAHSLRDMIDDPFILFGSQTSTNIKDVPTKDFIPETGPLTISATADIGKQIKVTAYVGALSENPDDPGSKQLATLISPQFANTIFNPGNEQPTTGEINFTAETVEVGDQSELLITSANSS